MKRLKLAGLTLVTALASMVGIAIMPAAQACGCGGFVSPEGEDVAAGAEYAVLSWDGETERVVLSMDAITTSSDAALLIPTPTPAEAALAETSVFSELEKVIEPEEVITYEWWPDLGFGAGAGEGGAPQGAPGDSGVSVLNTQQLGDLEVTVLAASDANELADWLDSHDYVMRDGLADALMPYVSEGWYYIAIRLTAEADTLEGALQPIDLTFASQQLIYPMRLSSAATESQFVRTYVFSDHKVRRTDETATEGQVELRFAGQVPAGALTADSLVSIAAEQPYLTVLDQYFPEPSAEIISDFTFGQASDDAPYRERVYETRMREIVGIPAGPALTFIGMVVLLTGTLIVSGVARRGRRRRQQGAQG
ncbi:DUF2330 domain-containing protein [Pseudactinotalea sp.]|uniref:DUF2330 domain-containing protein n=1 Tax=Pseudactinotalea sp. TaxID=1926260 RepID=UPI003B3AD725